MKSFTAANWILIDRPGVISHDSFHNAVATGHLRHDSMSHEVLGIDRYGSIAVIRTRGRNSGLFQGHPIKADEWTINIVLKEAGGWKCFLTQLTPQAPGRPRNERPKNLLQTKWAGPSMLQNNDCREPQRGQNTDAERVCARAGVTGPSAQDSWACRPTLAKRRSILGRCRYRRGSCRPLVERSHVLRVDTQVLAFFSVRCSARRESMTFRHDAGRS